MSSGGLRKALYFSLTVAGLAALLAVVYFAWLRRHSPEGGSKPPDTQYTVGEKPLYTAQENRKKVTLFFPDADGFLLVGQEREIYATSALTNQMKQVIVELIKGPDPQSADVKKTPDRHAALPEATRLREIYLRGDTAFVDFTREVSDNLGGGSLAEVLAVYSIVDSLTFNFPEVRRVKILVEGSEVETLGGHLNLLQPLQKNLAYVRAASSPEA